MQLPYRGLYSPLQEFVVPDALIAVYAGKREEGKTSVKKHFSADRQTLLIQGGEYFRAEEQEKETASGESTHSRQWEYREGGDNCSEFIED